MNGGPIFVVGSMRSGSTLLRLVLDSHPNIAIGAETGFMGALRGTKEIPSWKNGTDWYERLNWTEQEIDERLRDFYGGMFRRFADEQGKQRWGEKTPFHTAHMGEMAQVFPDAVFVGIVRHPGAVATSLRRHFHYTSADAVAYWTATNLALVRSGSELGGRFLACRYEDLVGDSEPVLREILDFLDEPWSADVLQHHQVQREKGAPRLADGSTRTRDAIDPERAGSWTHAATADDYRALERADQLAGFFGYQAVQPGVREPIAAARWTVTGDDLQLRRRAWEGRIDFVTQPPEPLVDASPQELAERLTRAEAALCRVRSRKAVRLGNALRKIQHGRSLGDVREAWSALRGPRAGTRWADGS